MSFQSLSFFFFLNKKLSQSRLNLETVYVVGVCSVLVVMLVIAGDMLTVSEERNSHSNAPWDWLGIRLLGVVIGQITFPLAMPKV